MIILYKGLWRPPLAHHFFALPWHGHEPAQEPAQSPLPLPELPLFEGQETGYMIAQILSRSESEFHSPFR